MALPVSRKKKTHTHTATSAEAGLDPVTRTKGGRRVHKNTAHTLQNMSRDII